MGDGGGRVNKGSANAAARAGTIENLDIAARLGEPGEAIPREKNWIQWNGMEVKLPP
jgi:hypothetical protein